MEATGFGEARLLATLEEAEVPGVLGDLLEVAAGDVSGDLVVAFWGLVCEAKVAATREARLQDNIDPRVSDALWAAQETKRKRDVSEKEAVVPTSGAGRVTLPRRGR